MTSAIPKPSDNQHAAHEHKPVFLPLLLCFTAGAVIAFFLGERMGGGTFLLAHSSPTGSVYDLLIHLTRCLRGVILQTGAVFLSAFLLSPSPVTVAVAIYRGMSLGYALFAVQNGRITGAVCAEAAVLLYFGATVLLMLASSLAHSAGEALHSPMCVGRRDRHAVLFAYIRWFLILSGAIFALSGFARLFC